MIDPERRWLQNDVKDDPLQFGHTVAEPANHGTLEPYSLSLSGHSNAIRSVDRALAAVHTAHKSSDFIQSPAAVGIGVEQSLVAMIAQITAPGTA